MKYAPETGDNEANETHTTPSQTAISNTREARPKNMVQEKKMKISKMLNQLAIHFNQSYQACQICHDTYYVEMLKMFAHFSWSINKSLFEVPCLFFI